MATSKKHYLSRDLVTGKIGQNEAIGEYTGNPEEVVRTNLDGYIDDSLLRETPVDKYEAFEALSAGDLVSKYDDAGTIKIAKADKTNAREAFGFVLVSHTAGETAEVYKLGRNTALSGLTAGARYYLDAAGGITTTPTTTAGEIHQYVGEADSATVLDFVFQDFIEIN